MYLTDSGIARLHNHMSQFLKIVISFYIGIYRKIPLDLFLWGLLTHAMIYYIVLCSMPWYEKELNTYFLELLWSDINV